MRILFISEKFPYPLDSGGNIRTFHLLQGLSRKHDVTLLVTTDCEIKIRHLQEVEKFCSEIKLVHVKPRSMIREVSIFVRSLFSRIPFVISRHFRDVVRNEIKHALKSEPAEKPVKSSLLQKLQVFDIVHFNHLDAAIYANVIPESVTRVLDQHNIITRQVKTTYKAEKSILKRMILKFECTKVANFEKELCNKMDLCLVCSEADARAMKLIGVKSRIAIVPNGADVDFFKPATLNANSDPKIVFVGTLDYDPCEKAVWYFCNKILPIIEKNIPGNFFFILRKDLDLKDGLGIFLSFPLSRGIVYLPFPFCPTHFSCMLMLFLVFKCFSDNQTCLLKVPLEIPQPLLLEKPAPLNIILDRKP